MKRNILILIGSFDQGGSERQAVQLARLLHESGRFRVHVACQKAEGVLRGEVDALDLGEIPEYPLDSFYDRNMLAQLNRFRRFLRERRIEVVQTFDFYTNVFGMLGATLARVPVRIAAKRETDGTRTPAQKFIEHRIFQLAHAVVANAEAVRRQLIRDGVRADKIVTIYNGMDTERVAPMPRLSRAEAEELFNLPRAPARRFVSIVANMRHAMKDQPTFLRAARRVRECVPEAAFVLAGEGELVPRIREYAAELGLGDDAYFIGRCAQVSELLNISDVCVLSSKGVEGFSNSITEYMAAARPVVATDIGGAREAIVEGETGYVVAPEDDAAMAERIIGLLKDPARARAMGARGRQVVAEKFSCVAQLGRVEDLYERLLAGRGAQPDGAKIEQPEEARGAGR